jgi:D-glycero-D-manno-heptose 1,7-bisphosphate phosphatase
MLYCFDLDGTLISGYMDNPDKDYHKWSVLPGRIETIRSLIDSGNQITIVTNQGGVAFGHVELWEAESKLLHTSSLLNILARDVYACYHDTRGKAPYNDPEQAARRKPSGAMIREAMAAHPTAAALGVLMVGDREEDQQAAQDAGVPFQWTHIFFKD